MLELSGDFSFYQKNYGGGSFEWSRHWGASVGYFILPSVEIQFSVADDFSKTVISGVQDTTLHDQNYSVDWVQSLTPKNWFVQPYVKAGVGQLNRTSSGSYVGETSPPEIYTTVSQTLGAGLRIYISHVFSIKTEASSYFPLGEFTSWQDNLNFTSGFSFYF